MPFGLRKTTPRRPRGQQTPLNEGLKVRMASFAELGTAERNAVFMGDGEEIEFWGV